MNKLELTWSSILASLSFAIVSSIGLTELAVSKGVPELLCWLVAPFYGYFCVQYLLRWIYKKDIEELIEEELKSLKDEK